MINLLIGQLILHLFVDHISREIDKKEDGQEAAPGDDCSIVGRDNKGLGAGVS